MTHLKRYSTSTKHLYTGIVCSNTSHKPLSNDIFFFPREFFIQESSDSIFCREEVIESSCRTDFISFMQLLSLTAHRVRESNIYAVLRSRRFILWCRSLFVCFRNGFLAASKGISDAQCTVVGIHEMAEAMMKLDTFAAIFRVAARMVTVSTIQLLTGNSSENDKGRILFEGTYLINLKSTRKKLRSLNWLRTDS